jgi:prephenate dehydrogenase
MLFNHIAIVGLGLIGGSLARVVRNKKLAQRVTAFGRNQERLQKAQQLGLVDGYQTGFDSGFEDVDLVVMATPAGTIVELARAIAPHLKPGTIITDVGSVKAAIVAALDSQLPRSINFIGGHPIAGTENSGFEASFAELFENRICVVTPTASSDQNALEQIRSLWTAAGSSVVSMDVDTHDKIFAAISHLPHMVAFSLVNAVVDMKDYAQNTLQYSAGGFRDFTRIAASDPIMWRDIALLNRDNLLATLDYFSRAIEEVKDAISARDGIKLETLFQRSRDARRKI